MPGYSASSSRSYPRASRRVWRSCAACVAPTFKLMLSRPQLVGNGSRSMIASAVDTRNKGFFVLARRRNTELRLPAISRDGASPSNGKVFSLGNTSTLSEAASEWSTLPSRSALFSFSGGIRCRYGRTSSIVRGDGAPTSRAARRRRSSNAVNPCFSSSHRRRRELFWFFPRKFHVVSRTESAGSRRSRRSRT